MSLGLSSPEAEKTQAGDLQSIALRRIRLEAVVKTPEYLQVVLWPGLAHESVGWSHFLLGLSV
jgi:hypothetical protein